MRGEDDLLTELRDIVQVNFSLAKSVVSGGNFVRFLVY